MHVCVMRLCAPAKRKAQLVQRPCCSCLSAPPRPVHPQPLQPGTVYGVKSDKAESAAPLINPPKLSAFEEARVRARQPELKSTVLAREHAAKLATSGAAYGTTTLNTGGSAADCIRPNISAEELEAEEQARKALYVKSHGACVSLPAPLTQQSLRLSSVCIVFVKR